MRALRLVLAFSVLLAAGAAQNAEPVKIRGSWIVAPSGRLGAVAPGEARSDEGPRQVLRLRADALPGHAGGHHRDGEQRARARQSCVFLARTRDPERGVGGPAHRRRPIQGRRPRPLQQSVLRAQGQPGAEGRRPQGEDRGRRNSSLSPPWTPALRAILLQGGHRGQARLHRGRGAVSPHEGHARRRRRPTSPPSCRRSPSIPSSSRSVVYSSTRKRRSAPRR